MNAVAPKAAKTCALANYRDSKLGRIIGSLESMAWSATMQSRTLPIALASILSIASMIAWSVRLIMRRLAGRNPSARLEWPRLARRIDGNAVGEPVLSLVRHHHPRVLSQLWPDDAKLGRQFVREAGGNLAVGEYHSVAIVHRASTNEVEVESRHLTIPQPLLERLPIACGLDRLLLAVN